LLKVSVLILTYNHELFIAQAIESALMQQVDFDYEIVIGEDCSTDTTREIVIRYAEKFPEKIRLLLNEKNIGGHDNFAQSTQSCRGQYVAYLEGDDYWLSSSKLQQQVDFLDNHPDFVICFHNARVFLGSDDSEPTHYCAEDQKPVLEIEDLFKRNFIPSSSLMYRQGVVPEIPDWFRKLKLGDLPLYILYAEKGKIGYINQVMSVYRIHEYGSWSRNSLVWQLKEIIKMYQTLNVHLNYRYETSLEETIENYYQQLIRAAQQEAEQSINLLQQDLQAAQQSSQAAQLEVAMLQAALKQAHTDLSECQNSLQLQQDRLQQTKIKLQKMRRRFHNKQSELEQSQQIIQAMESSKFWKLRQVWVRFKQKIRLAQD
jgi:glycosyltransferase involved in cell wall biosynthesis